MKAGWWAVIAMLVLLVLAEAAAIAWNVGWQRGVSDGRRWGYDAARDSCAVAESVREAARYYGAP